MKILGAENEEKKANFSLSSLLNFLGLEGKGEIELEDVDISVGNLEIFLPSTVATMPPSVVSEADTVSPLKIKPTAILEAPFTLPLQEYPAQIREVTLGVNHKTVTIGGGTSPSFYTFENPPPHPPVIALDIFDMEVSLPKAIRMHVEEVMLDTAAWATMAVDRWGADVVTVHLLSTDPLIKDASPKDASKTIENVLQAVDVPIIVGGCGDPKKDALLFKKIAEVAEGERVVLSSVTLDMAEAGVLDDVAKAPDAFDCYSFSGQRLSFPRR